MATFIKKFNTYKQYDAYIVDGISYPNISYSKFDNIVSYYNEDYKATAVFNINPFQYLFFEDFPQDICDSEYEGNFEKFVQDAINSVDEMPEDANGYGYTGDTFTYDGKTYYLWESYSASYYGEDNACNHIKYILTDRLDFTGLSLEENLDSTYCPYIYILDENNSMVYTNNDDRNDILLCTRTREVEPTYIMTSTEISNNVPQGYEQIEIDDLVIDKYALPTYISDNNSKYYYMFNKPGKHTVKYTLEKNNNFYLVESEELISLIFPNYTEVIYGFDHCYNLESITIPNSVKRIDSYTFMECNNIKYVHIKSIESWCNITFESTVANPLRFNANLVLNGTIIENLVIPYSISQIKSNAFFGCISIKNITIHENVTNIGDDAFYDCSNLKNIYIKSITPPTLGTQVFGSISSFNIYVPSESVNTYKSATGWSSYANKIKAI